MTEEEKKMSETSAEAMDAEELGGVSGGLITSSNTSMLLRVASADSPPTARAMRIDIM